MEPVVVTGTRRYNRTVTQSVTPIDVFTSQDLLRQGSSDTNSLFQNVIPSFSVPQAAISTGSSFIRPPNLRGLPPDQTLVLINSKRRHRSALVNVDVSALSLLSQAVDLSQIPAIAIDRVEVLRDGASAQYGSDAIAGVINIALKKANSGFSGQARYGQFYEGDGRDYQVALNNGFALGDNGFLNVSAEYAENGATSRGTQRPGALQLSQQRPALNIPDPVQKWGKTAMEAKRLFANGEIDLDGSTLYFFGNYGRSDGEQNFNYRQPFDTTNFARTALFGVTYYLDQLPNGNRNAAGATFDFTKMFPAGFTPIFSGKIEDLSETVGYRGTAGELTYDVSASYGQNQLQYYLDNTVNPSYGPQSPTSFYLGKLRQSEVTLNADASYPVEVGFASPLNIALGAEYRRDTYEVGLGDRASWNAGPFVRQVVQRPDSSTFTVISSVGSNGSVGFGPDNAGSSSRRSYAGYVDLETDVTDTLTIGAAARYEDFNTFGSTANVKGSARYEVSPDVAIRGAASTGFHAPTPGQTNVNNVLLSFIAGSTTPVQTGTFAVNHPAAVYFGAVPVKPEKSVNLTGGVVVTPGGGFNLTMDYYNIVIRDRLGLSQAFVVTDRDRAALTALGVSNAFELNRLQYLTNAFKTRTQGIDAVLTHSFHTDNAGTFNSSLSVNYNKTDVLKRNPAIISNDRVANLEKTLPRTRVNFTETWENGPLSVLARVNYYDKFTVTSSNNAAQTFGSEVIVDVEATYDVTEQFSLSLGVQNLFDNYPDKDLRSIDRFTGLPGNGNQYIDASPFGYNGGFWYVRAGWSF
ncbi:TonB-dependent receptor plug domain-containing protein [Niveispirillum lacus]|uniref:TonB-dependent receptor plug domain-containing protein n=1 Tax=Niveispirillum lacus TaxID=1981099 RepID=UPI001A9C3C43|nr:TonB-dependent receptor [Niveispirillum lacus]